MTNGWMLLGAAALTGACASAPAPSPTLPKGDAKTVDPDSLASAGPCKTAQTCGAACTANDAPSCARLGRMLVYADGAPRSRAEGHAILEKGCDLGNGDACDRLVGEWVSLGRSPTDVEALAQRGCDAGSPRACASLVGLKRLGIGSPLDEASAQALDTRIGQLLTTSCDAGDAHACGTLLDHLNRPGVDPADVERARERYGERRQAVLQSCREGDAIACADASGDLMLSPGLGMFSKPDPDVVALARDVATRGCDLDVAGACSQLGNFLGLEPPESTTALDKSCRLGSSLACDALETGGGPANPRARALLTSDCDLGDASACYDLAQRLERQGRPASELDPIRKRARPRLIASCRVGGNCFEAARAVEKGWGDPPDPALVLELLAIPCRSSGVCDALAERLMTSGDPAQAARGLAIYEEQCTRNINTCPALIEHLERAPSPDRAHIQALRDRVRQDYERTCEQGMAPSCGLLAMLYENGEGVPKDAAKAAAYRARECELGGFCTE